MANRKITVLNPTGYQELFQSGDVLVLDGSVDLQSNGITGIPDPTQNLDCSNKKYVDDSIRDNPTFQIIDDNTRVIVTDKEVTGSLQYLIDNTGYSSYSESAVSVLIDNTLNTQFYANRALVQGFEFNQNEPGSPTITVNNTNDSIFLQTNGTGKVRLNYGLQLDQIAVDLAYIQEENRKIVIMANNPDAKTYKEALKNELGLGCKFIDDDDD